jgi:hypothetical protein
MKWGILSRNFTKISSLSDTLGLKSSIAVLMRCMRRLISLNIKSKIKAYTLTFWWTALISLSKMIRKNRVLKTYSSWESACKILKGGHFQLLTLSSISGGTKTISQSRFWKKELLMNSPKNYINFTNFAWLSTISIPTLKIIKVLWIPLREF